MDGIARIERVVANFQVWLDGTFPIAKMKVKVTQSGTGDHLAFANVAVIGLESKQPEWIAGLGDTIDEAVTDLLARFVQLARENTPPGGLQESDLHWSAHEDF